MTDSAGLVLLQGLTKGEWQIQVERKGYETGRFETPLPGPWESHIPAHGFVDMQQFGIASLRALSLQLTEAAGWDDLTLFSANHSSITPALPFDANGRLDLELGSFAAPLFLYVVYPDGQQSAMNILGELPPANEAVEIPVGGEGSLEVALHVSDAVREEIGGNDCYLRVFFGTTEGDTRRIRQKAEEDGLFEFGGIQGERATICFHVEATSGRSDWALQEVQLQEGETTRTTFSVDSLPPTLQFVDETDSPIAGLWTELYVLPHDSTWHRGNSTDESGITTAPRIDRGQIAYFAALGENEVFAVDATLPDLTPGHATKVRIPERTPTFVRVTLDGEPAAQAYVEVLGSMSGRSFDASYTDEHGRSRATGLTSDSSAVYRVILPGAWWEHRTAPLVPGRNTAALRRTGVLRSSSEETLLRALHMDTSSDVGGWAESGLVKVRPSASGVFEATVPVGSYRIHPGRESERIVLLEAGGVAQIEP